MLDITPEAFAEMAASPLIFARQMWGLEPQPIKEQYADIYIAGLATRGEQWTAFCESVKPYWFGEYVDGKHLTYQQTLVLYGIEKALRGEAPSRLSAVSGHGIGKSATLAIVILWFLFVKQDSQVACTAPTADQMYDVLWKELKKWLERMPPQIGALYLWESSHIRVAGSEQTWFARAKTSSKENTEALAGVHADWVLMVADEASGIEEPIFETMEGALTSGNTLVILMGNGTRALGYFYDSQHKDKPRWQTFQFSSLDSPRVNKKYTEEIVAKYGADSVQYAIRVEGKFPDEGVMDDKGYVQMFAESDLHIVHYNDSWVPTGRAVASLDPSGEGQDSSAWAVKDTALAGIVAEELTSTAKGMAMHSMTILEKFRVKPEDFIIDAFGAGHAVSQEIALATAKLNPPWRVTPVNTGEPPELEVDKDLYLNKRAEAFHKLLLWCRAGGELMWSERLKDEMLSIRFRRTTTGKIQIMSKIEMKRLGFASPNKADALSMLFLASQDFYSREEQLDVWENQNARRETIRNDVGIVG